MRELHVSENGRDSNSGTKRTPLRTLKAARDKIRASRGGDVSERFLVQVEKGTYPLSAALRFTPMDGNVTYRGAEGAVVDGGVQISNWRETTANGVKAWVADLPTVKQGHWQFRQLFVNGQRRPRARYPKFGYDADAIGKVFRVAETRKTKDGAFPPMLHGDFTFKPHPGDVQPWKSLYDAEIVMLHAWVEDRLPNPRLHPETGWIECARQSIFRHTESFAGTALARYYIDNLFEALTEPGEWFLDRHAGTLTYLPKSGETPKNTTVVAPCLEHFVQVEGVPFNREKRKGDLHGLEPVRNLRFENLTFHHADWHQPQAEALFHDALPEPRKPLALAPQGAVNVPGALRFMATKDCAVNDCRVEHVGFHAIDVGPGCRGFECGGNTMRDIGGGGVKIHGGELDEAAWRRTGHCSVHDNTIENGGRVFHSAAGILLGNTFENVVAHNRIHDFFYTGISIGWSWGYRDTISRDNAILNNHVSEIGQGLLSDMGLIYTLGVQPGTVIAGNKLHGIQAHDYGSYGIYLDEGSSHVVVEDNLIHDLDGPNLTHHFGRENIIRRNVFLSDRQCVASIGLEDDECSDTFHHNLMVSHNGFIYRGGYGAVPENCFDSDVNWIVLKSGVKPYTDTIACNPRPGLSWTKWQALGNDNFSTVKSLSAKNLPTNAKETLAFLKQHSKLAAVFGLQDPTWKNAGPRPRDHRPPLWQPLKRRCVDANAQAQ